MTNQREIIKEMKKILSTVLFLFVCITAVAQMSEEQIISYVQKQKEAGKDEKEIAKDLIARGVSVTKLQQLSQKYKNMKGKSSNNTDNDINRSRISNGEKRIEDDDMTMMYEEEDSVKIFGHDIFRSKELSFEPGMNIATPSNYTLGPGDEVILDIYGASQYSGSFNVSPDGCITIPDEGPIYVAGLNVAQAQAKVKRTIGAHYQDSNIKLTIGQTRAITVSVMGEVKTPGTYSISAFATVFNALYLAGGVNKIGTLREVKVSRNGRIITTVDIYDYIINGRLTGNVMLQDNDVILVGPYCSLVKAEGHVKRPMYYEMKKNESLQSLLNYCGGFTGYAYKKKVRIERISDDGLTVHNVDEFDFSSFHVADGDVMVVDSVIERYKNTVKIRGAVFREGQYRLDNKVNSVKTLVEQAGGVLEFASTTRAVLRRICPDRTYKTISVPLAAILDGTTPDMVLQNEDELFVSSFEELNKQRNLAIYGEVFKPGIYKYSEGETVEDLITEAGGLLESASLLNVEVARRISSSQDNLNGKTMATIFSIVLKDGLPIEGETTFKLKPYDIVTIHRSPDYQEQKVVHVSGEVNYGGMYVLSNKEERLTDILKRAGGLTPNAYINGVQVIRKVSQKELDIQLMKLEVAKTKSDSIEIHNLLDKTTYTVGVDLQKALDNPGSSSDIVLNEGDSIYVPQLNNVVKISGEVMFPNVVAFRDKKSPSFYINQAGGISKNGKKSLSYIVYPNGQVSNIRKGKVLPGCEIVVPTKPEKKVDTQRTSLWLAIASSVATIAAVLITALK